MGDSEGQGGDRTDAVMAELGFEHSPSLTPESYHILNPEIFPPLPQRSVGTWPGPHLLSGLYLEMSDP